MRCRIIKDTPLGGELTPLERKCLNVEVEKAIKKQLDKVGCELDAVVLQILNQEFGFGEKRLRKFHKAYVENVRRVVDHYCLEEGDEQWIAKRWLKDKGYDLEGDI